MAFDRVYTMTDYYDGPRGGVADFEGVPHLYESEWDDKADDYAPTFRLGPIPVEILDLALEDWAIWERWWVAFQAGRTTHETHPALPQERSRHLELKARLQDRLRIDPSNYVRVRGEFRRSPKQDRAERDPLGG